MRRIAFTLVLMVASGWAAPSQAQWPGGDWGRPRFGGCRPWRGEGGWAGPRRFVILGCAPRPAWRGPEGFGPPRFRAGAWGWGRTAWRREMRWRRFEAWRRWAGAGRQAASPEAERPRLRRWTRWRHPLPAEATATRPVAPWAATGGPGRAEPAVGVFPSGALAAAAALRRPVVPAFRPAPMVPAMIRGPNPPARPVGLRSQGEVPPASQPPAAAPATPGAAPTDVPVAPLD